MAKILILIGAHLSTAPRPQKEAATLAAAGHDVTVAGAWFDEEWSSRDDRITRNVPYRFCVVADMRPRHRAMNLWTRLRKRAAKEAFTRLGLASKELLGNVPGLFLRFAHSHGADLTIVHSEGGLWVGEKLLRMRRRVGVDLEDWFSRDLEPRDRGGRPVHWIEALERTLLNRCAYSITTSAALANAIAGAYGCRAPGVVYNSFPRAEAGSVDGLIKDRQKDGGVSLHWFSQSVGRGRGLETLIAALEHVRTPVQIHLRGERSPVNGDWIDRALPPAWRRRFHIHRTVPNGELFSRIAEHDIGLALDLNTTPNRELTVTNKMFQYLQAGLAVIATGTPGHAEVLSRCAAAGTVFPPSDARALAIAIDGLAGDPARLAAARSAARQAANTVYCFETQREVIVRAAERALGTP